jgi:hypothetical protein
MDRILVLKDVAAVMNDAASSLSKTGVLREPAEEAVTLGEVGNDSGLGFGLSGSRSVV